MRTAPPPAGSTPPWTSLGHVHLHAHPRPASFRHQPSASSALVAARKSKTFKLELGEVEEIYVQKS